MADNQLPVKKILIRVFSILLMIVSVLFGVTWKKNGYCMGDEFLTGLGLNAWSNGTQGTHYTALVALALLVIAFMTYAMTTEKRMTTFRYFLVGVIVLSIFFSMVY